MNTRFYLSLTFLLACATLAQATVIRVNNREPSVPEENTYDNLEDAYNKALGGDTLYIEGSPDGYGSLTLNKPLTIIGTGYFLTDNPSAPALKQRSSVRRLTFNSGSEGSRVEGVSFVVYQSRVSVYANNIKVVSCYFGVIDPIDVNKTNREPVKNLSITKCYFSADTFSSWYQVDPPIDFYFANNIVLGAFVLKNNITGTIIHNVFAGDVFKVGTTSPLEIHNNILLGDDPEEVILPPLGTNISHNIAALQQFGSENNNQINVGENQIFINTDDATDARWQIKADGVAAGTGRDGSDIGAFGGPDPYRLSGLPSIPRITDLSTDGIVNENGQLQIKIQVSAN